MVYREAQLRCPACRTILTAVVAAGRRFQRCPGCRGVFVDEAVLASMYADMTAGRILKVPHGVVWASSHRPPDRDCPRCEARMEPRVIATVVVERCEVHGFWFDHEELEVALRNETPPAAGSGSGSVAGIVADGAELGFVVLRVILEILS